MDNNKKVYRKSGVTIACYVFAAILLLYTCYLAGTTVGQINEYYAAYGMSAKPMEYVTYVAQSALPQLIYTVIVFMLGHILDAVRKTDPKNYMTEEEYQDAKAAKREAKEAKKIAKGEKKAAARAGAEADENTVAEDFANDLDKELKAAEKKDDHRKSGGNKRYYNQNRNYNNNHRQNGSRQGGNKNGNGGRRNNNQSGSQNQNHNNNNNNNQSKQAVAEKPVAEAQDKTNDVFEAKVFEDK